MTTQTEALKLALEALESCHITFYEDEDIADAITAIKEALAQPGQEPKCNPHPKAPHGFNRNASHANDRYTCECEGWDAYDAGYQAGVMAGIEASMGQEPEQEPVAYINIEKRRLEWAHNYVSWNTPTTIKLDRIPLYTKEKL